MKLRELVESMQFQVRAAAGALDREVTGGYASDLLSDVLAHATDGDLWVTLQSHENVVAVASLKGVVGIVLVSGREPQEETLEKAESEGIPILVSALPAFDLVGRLYGLGLRTSVDLETREGGAS